MSNKRFILLILSIVMFSFSFICLLSAMIIHAVSGDKNLAPCVLAIISFALAFVAVITICLFGKGEPQQKEEKQ